MVRVKIDVWLDFVCLFLGWFWRNCMVVWVSYDGKVDVVIVVYN